MEQRWLPRLIFVVLLWAIAPVAPAQQDLLAQLSAQPDSAPEYVTATFKGTRVINQQTVETTRGKTLDFLLQHRFGSLGVPNSFLGWDGPINARISLEYGINDRLAVGVGRSTNQKLWDGFVKYRLLRQRTHGMPISLSLAAGAYITERKGFTVDSTQNKFVNRISYSYEVFVARKFNDQFSAQVSIAYVHMNLPPTDGKQNDFVGAGLALRYKVSRRTAIIVDLSSAVTEYTYRQFQRYYPAVGVGAEFETGGHIFQVYLTNSFGLIPPQYLAYEKTSIDAGGLRIGFNLARSFSFSKGSHIW